MDKHGSGLATIEQALQARDWQTAMTLAGDYLRLEPGNPDALLAFGVALRGAGRRDEAVGVLRQVLAAQPERAEAHIVLGKLMYAAGRYRHAVQHLRRAASLVPVSADVHLDLGNARLLLGKPDAAIKSYQRALRVNPDYAQAHCNLGMACQATGRQEQALEAFRAAVTLRSDFAEAHNNLGTALDELGQHAEAIESYQAALAIQPGYAQALTNMGVALLKLGEGDRAIRCHRDALRIKDELPEAHFNLANSLRARGDATAALPHYRRAIELCDSDFRVYAEYGLALKYLGEIDAAAQQFKRALALRPGHAETWRLLATVQPDQGHRPALESRLAQADDPRDAMHCHYALGGLLDRVGDYRAAFQHYHQANRIRRRDLRYSAAGFSRYVTALVEFFDEAYFAGLPGGGADQHAPIFIVGLPRSGTTLVEQIVSSHSEVCAGGESLAMPAVERRIRKDWAGGYPSALRGMGREALASLAKVYLAGLGTLEPGATRKTDKLPGNFLSIGLIRTLFPQAAIVHCRRDLRDSCVSMYLNYFPDGNEHSCQLDELAAYAVDYQRVMAHWYARVDGVITVDYERLVADQEAESRALLTGLGLAWEPACLDFAANPAAVNTASSVQVRQGMYRSSIGRWKHYREPMAPLLEALSAVLECD